jgi:hypothetical protein
LLAQRELRLQPLRLGVGRRLAQARGQTLLRPRQLVGLDQHPQRRVHHRRVVRRQAQRLLGPVHAARHLHRRGRDPRVAHEHTRVVYVAHALGPLEALEPLARLGQAPAPEQRVDQQQPQRRLLRPLVGGVAQRVQTRPPVLRQLGRERQPAGGLIAWS